MITLHFKEFRKTKKQTNKKNNKKQINKLNFLLQKNQLVCCFCFLKNI